MLARSPHVIDPVFLPLGQHMQPEVLREQLQKEIDSASASGIRYDAILLLYGICGNATHTLQARQFPLVLPRAHDCCTILLGSRAAFDTYFGAAPSTPFSSVGYYERGAYHFRVCDDGMQMFSDVVYEDYVAQYGEENARYIWETLHPMRTDVTPVYIEIPEVRDDRARDAFEEDMRAQGKECRVIEGSLTLIQALLHGAWDAEAFLQVPPGHTIKALYDNDTVVCAVSPSS